MKKVLFGVLLGLVGIPLLAVAVLWFAGMRSGAGHTGGSIVIDRPAAEIWPYFTEVEKLKTWQSGIQEITRLSGDGVSVGAKSRVLASSGPDEHPFPMTHVYTAVEPPKRLAYTLSAEQQGMGFVGKFQVRLDEENGATTVTLLSDTVYRGAIPELFEPLITASAQSKSANDLRALKTLIEGAQPAAPVAEPAADPAVPPAVERAAEDAPTANDPTANNPTADAPEAAVPAESAQAAEATEPASEVIPASAATPTAEAEEATTPPVDAEVMDEPAGSPEAEAPTPPDSEAVDTATDDAAPTDAADSDPAPAAE